jgi:large repetitive protein
VNTATVSSVTPDPDLSNNEATVDTPVPPETDLEIQKSASLSTITAGGQVTYTLVVKNNGPHDATRVIVIDRPPPGLGVVSAEPSQGTCASETGVLCALGAILNGASAQILVTANVAPSASGALTNTAVVIGGQTDPDPGNNSASATVDVTPLTPAPLPAASEVLASITTAPDQASSDLRIVKQVDHATARPRQRLTYTLTITNDGLDDDPDVIVTDTWSLPLKILSARPVQGACRMAATLTCELGTIKRDASTTITIVAMANHAGQERNTARATGANRDPDLRNNQSSADTDITSAAHTPGKAPIVTG